MIVALLATITLAAVGATACTQGGSDATAGEDGSGPGSDAAGDGGGSGAGSDTAGDSAGSSGDDAASSSATTVEVSSDVVYGTGQVAAPRPARADLLLDIYRPAGEPDGARPVVVLIHGGGFARQSKTDAGLVTLARALAAEGIVAVSIDYRLIGQQPVPSSRVAPLVDVLPGTAFFTAVATAVDDTLTAVDYLERNADDLGIDVDRLGLVGSSAGAITADHVGYVLDDHGIEGPEVRFVASLWGGIFVPAPGGPDTDPADQLEAGEPALFAVHGDADEIVPVALGDALVARARAEDVPVDYHRIAGGGHGYVASGFSTAAVDGDQTPFDRLIAFASESLR